MTREEKDQLIDELSAKFGQNQSFLLLDSGGMSVEQIGNFRRKIFALGYEYKVAKNTLIQKALERQPADHSEIFEALKGVSGVLFVGETAKASAQMLKAYYKEGNAKPLLKAASIDASAFIGADKLDTLVALKSKQELIGEVLGLLQSPIRTVVSQLQSGGHKIGGLIKALEERQSN